MKRFIRCVCLLLVAATVMVTPAFAAESGDSRASNYFAASDVYLWKISDSQFQVWFEVTAVGMMDKLGVCEIVVERSSDNVNWSPSRTFTKDYYSQMTGENTSYHDGYVTYTFTKGYYYRAMITLYAEKSNGSAEYIRYTDTMDLRNG